MRDADRVIGILNTSDIEPIQLVINRVSPNMMASQEMLSIEDVQGILSLPLLGIVLEDEQVIICLLYTSPSPRDATLSRMPSSA